MTDEVNFRFIPPRDPKGSAFRALRFDSATITRCYAQDDRGGVFCKIKVNAVSVKKLDNPLDKTRIRAYNMRIILKLRCTMKNEKSIYKTSQSEILLSFLRAHPDEEFSTEEITVALAGEAIGKSTVYRLISKLCERGEILRTRGENGKKILYRYIDKSHDCDEHFHLKCRDCGKIIHLDCGLMDELKTHIAGEHGFRLDARSTVINGVCAECEEREREE